MKAMRYIKPANLKLQIPIDTAILYWLLMERLNSPTWLWVVAYTYLGVVTVVAIIEGFFGESVDLLD